MLEHSGKRILLVDDHPLIRNAISRHLVAAGYVVHTAVDGLDALKRLRAGLPDLIISDLNMPHMSGHEFLGVVRKRFPRIPVILVSSVAANELPQEVAADAYCQKNEVLSDNLLDTISDLARNLHLRDAPPPVDNEPVQARWDDSGHYIIVCADCLREFVVPRVFHLVQDENWTVCGHCGKLVQFVVDEHSEAA